MDQKSSDNKQNQLPAPVGGTGNTDSGNAGLDQTSAELNTRLEAFLALKSPNTQRTYRGIIQEWCAFLSGEETSEVGGPSESSPTLAEKFSSAGELEAIRYKKWLEGRPGQSPRLQRSSSQTQALLARSEKMKQRRDGTQSTLTNSTIAKKFAALRRIYRMLLSHDLVKENPFDTDKVPVPKAASGQKRPTEMIPFEKVREIVGIPNLSTPKGVRDKALLSILFGAGLRRSEAVNLRLGDVHRSRQGTVFVRLRATKSGKDCNQTLPDWAAQNLTRLLEHRMESGAESADFLFVSFRGRGGAIETNEQLSTSGVYKLFRHYCNKAGVEGHVSPHSARATAITKLLQDGISHREVQEFSRHASVQMVEAYDKRRLGVEDNPAKKLSFEDS